MKTSVIALVSLSILVLSGRIPAAQPQMNEAIEQLEAARKAKHPVEHLEKALHHLEAAKKDKGGERVEAIHQTMQAISAAKKDEHRLMEEHITKAIHDIREGKAIARKEEKKKKRN